MEKIGLVAGNGSLPVLFLERAKRKGYKVFTLAIKNESLLKVADLSEKALTLPPGRLNWGLKFFEENGVREAIMLGQVKHRRLLHPHYTDYLDPQLAQILKEISDKQTATVLKAIIEYFEHNGIHFLPSTYLLEDLLLASGFSVGPPLSEEEKSDIALGRKVAETLASLDVGLTVAVKNGIVLAVEAIEGTDLTMRRAARFSQGIVVVKVSRPNQDLRFDLPVIGPATITNLARISGRALAISPKTLVLEKERVFRLAERYGITLSVF